MKEPTVIAVVGGKSSGKTTTMEALIRELSNRGYRVAAAKHVPEPSFTMDHVGKDTWRFAQSGAKTILSVAAGEVATIEKVNPNDFSLKRILQKCGGNDLVFLEGFRGLVGKDKHISKIVVVKSAEEVAEAVKTFDPILAFAGPYSTKHLKLAIPYVDVLKNPEEIADIVETVVEKSQIISD